MKVALRKSVAFGADEVRAVGSALTCYRVADLPNDAPGVEALRLIADGSEVDSDTIRLACDALERIAAACDEQTSKKWWKENGAEWISDHYIKVRQTQLDWVVNAAQILYDALSEMNPASQMAISDERI